MSSSGAPKLMLFSGGINIARPQLGGASGLWRCVALFPRLGQGRLGEVAGPIYDVLSRIAAF
eukprot:9998384-Lingulodinium_polyedra.AAC.1